MTVYNLFYLYRDGDDYLAQSFLGTYATHSAAAEAADASTQGAPDNPNFPPRPKHTHTAPMNADTFDTSEGIERTGEYSARHFVILPTSVQGV